MASKLERAPWGPTPLEVYVACRALRQPVPRAEVKRLVREKLINSHGELTPAGNGQIGRLRHLRKQGLVDAKPVAAPGIAQETRTVHRNYPGLGPRRLRRLKRKADRINAKRFAKLLP